MTSKLRRFRRVARAEADSLEEPVAEAAALARKLGLDPYPVNYWVVDHDEMSSSPTAGFNSGTPTGGGG